MATRYRGHAAELAARAASEGVDLVVVLGGDGTVNEALNGLLVDGPQETGAGRSAWCPAGPRTSSPAPSAPRGTPWRPPISFWRPSPPTQARTVGLGRADERWFSFNAGLGVGRRRHRRHGARPGPRPRGDPDPLRGHLLPAVGDGAGQPAVVAHRGIPGHDPVEGVKLALVSNTGPVDLPRRAGRAHQPRLLVRRRAGPVRAASARPAHHRADGPAEASEDGFTELGAVLRDDDVPALRVTSDEPVNLQVDGDHLGRRSDVEFFAVPHALRVVV